MSDRAVPSKSRVDEVADRALLERVRARDVAGLASLYDRHASLVYGVAYRELGDADAACQVVERVFEDVWLHPEVLTDGSESLCPALLVRARTLAIDRGAPDNMAAMRPETQNELSDLPPIGRIALELAFFDGLSLTDIARRLDLPEDDIDARLRDALLRLRDTTSPP